MPFTLFIPTLFEADLIAAGVSPSTAEMKVHERKRDIRRVEGALEGLGIKFKHEKVGTTATLSTADTDALRALLPSSLPVRAALDIQEIPQK